MNLLASVVAMLLSVLITGAALVVIAVRSAPAITTPGPSHPQEALMRVREQLGRRLFFDTGLSEPAGTSCASCHDPMRAFSGNHGSSIGVAVGSKPGSYGLRNTPTLTYASFVPPFTVDREEEPLEPKGGQFLDGRVSYLFEQAEGPLLNPLEMNNLNRASVVAKVAAAYGPQFRSAFGADIFSRGTDRAFLAIGAALQAFESTPVFHPFSSRFDRFRQGTLQLDDAEARGMKLFFDPAKGNCFTCHQARPQFAKSVAFFTDFGYETLGTPRNPRIPANADPAFFDLGLGGPKGTVPRIDASFSGAFRTPTLRNVAVKQAFMHNGVFKRLEEVVAFYATRDTRPAHWYPKGVPFDDTPQPDQQYINTGAPFGGHPGGPSRLQPQEIIDVVMFLRSLTDQPFEASLPPVPTTQSLGDLNLSEPALDSTAERSPH